MVTHRLHTHTHTHVWFWLHTTHLPTGLHVGYTHVICGCCSRCLHITARYTLPVTQSDCIWTDVGCWLIWLVFAPRLNLPNAFAVVPPFASPVRVRAAHSTCFALLLSAATFLPTTPPPYAARSALPRGWLPHACYALRTLPHLPLPFCPAYAPACRAITVLPVGYRAYALRALLCRLRIRAAAV